MKTRSQIQINGIVQGVGFRPFVFDRARQNALKGRVLNNASGVLVDVEGKNEQIEAMIGALKTDPPPLSMIESITRRNISELADFDSFEVLSSETNGNRRVPISADVATCADCIREMFDPTNRRYRYPFINCTNCGPRFTIVESVPYDRERTTMRHFEMCGDCRAEYSDPANRRFHAEPTCCPACGPSVFLPDPQTRIPESAHERAICEARNHLENGKILAVKGIGGFHLVCDATNEKAVKELRARKYREDKPFALMANSVEIIEKYCFVSAAEKELLLSKERPIVLLHKRPDMKIPDAVAPRVNSLGFMLPYAPLHLLLFENSEKPWVMTSGNISDEPIAYEDHDAVTRLGDIADVFLLHDREIAIRTDDSVVRIPDIVRRESPNNAAYFLRRSRGYAPAPIRTSFKFARQILACGAELKNTFCLARGDHAYLSHHIGDLENLETLRSFKEGIEHFKRLYDLRPEVIAHDLHPEYLSTKYALDSEEIATKIAVQHHHAHIASCIADNGVEGEVIGVAMDGLGFGTDGKFWGGEFFIADLLQAERIAHLENIPMPGGSRAIREPWRLAAIYLQRSFGDDFLDLNIPFARDVDRSRWSTLCRMVESGTNSPETSSMGRLFDAVAALIGLRSFVNYEGQAAIELEAMSSRTAARSYEFVIGADGLINTEKLIKTIVEDLLSGVPVAEIAAGFHLAVANLVADAAENVRRTHKIGRVALSGGVFQNMLLLENAVRLLHERDFEVFTHHRVPANDGGISLGQAAVANAMVTAGRI